MPKSGVKFTLFVQICPKIGICSPDLCSSRLIFSKVASAFQAASTCELNASWASITNLRGQKVLSMQHSNKLVKEATSARVRPTRMITSDI
jgi:hypothetical protein